MGEPQQQARQLAKIHALLHEKPLVVEIPSLHESLAFKLGDAKPLPENLRTAALEALEEMPEGTTLCHGDFHPGNILLCQSEPIIIDWIDATIGSPLADVARTSILALGAGSLDNPRYQQFDLLRFHSVYLERYFELRPGGHDEYKRWLPIVAAAHLNEGVPGWDEWLLAQANALL